MKFIFDEKIGTSKRIKKSICFFALLTIFLLLTLRVNCSPVFDKEKRNEIYAFLNLLAMAEQNQWPNIVNELDFQFPELMKEPSLRMVLNNLKTQILASDDLDLIKLYNRAVRNHDTLSIEKADPVVSFYRHYQPPPFLIPNIHLTFNVYEDEIHVTTDLRVKRNSRDTSLILDGKDHLVHEVRINEQKVARENYKVTPHELILLNIPENEFFNVTIESVINPFKNECLEGMYQCGQILTTQCESEGARRIFFTLDRPDVLSCMTTTIIADKAKYPYRLSNGNFIEEHNIEDGRTAITWSDPFPKPSYLFACVLGNFSRLTSVFTTKSGKNVALEIFVEDDKQSRGQYALHILKKAMEFDEKFFDREYDLNSLKMVAIPNFNSGAMENKGLIIFNDIRLLVDDQSGIDKSYRDVAHVIGHEYFHNWSGNRVTVRNWFEIALKEAFTDLKAMLFSEWLFGEEFIRPKAVRMLREFQFPEETSEKGHPIMVESYVDAHSIYDQTTYVKGREVFRTLKNYIDMLIPDGFKEVQNLYFNRYDGQAVTFQELLSVANEVLKKVNKDLSLFERWFYQPGTPIIKAEMNFDPVKKITKIDLSQECLHPKTGKKQDPFLIPFSLELLAKDGTIIQPKLSYILDQEYASFKFSTDEKPIPIFMHGYCAPVKLQFDYTLEDLALIAKHATDSFCRWEAAQNYSLMAFKEMMRRIKKDPSLETRAKNGFLTFTDLFEFYLQAIELTHLSPLAKAQILEAPSLRSLSQALKNYDFERLHQLREIFLKQMALLCHSALENQLEKNPAFSNYEPEPEQMEVREYRNAILSLLVIVDEKYKEKIFSQYQSANNFEDRVSAFNLCLNMGNPYKGFVVSDFYNRWKTDKAIFNFWLSNQAISSDCSIDDLYKLETVEGFDAKNANHIRSLSRGFTLNLHRYHHSSGEGYRYIVDKVLEVAKFNPMLAHNYIAIPALLDYDQLPSQNKTLMAKELKRLLEHDIPAQTRDLVERTLERCENAN